MLKRLFIFLISVCLIFLLTACDSSKYSQAKSAYDSEDYETAISLFEELGDYENSKEMLKDSLDTYIIDLRYAREWEKATVYLEKYKTLVSESKYKEIYCEAIEGFVSGFCYDEKWEKATSIVDDCCDEFNVENLYSQITYQHGIKLLEDEKFNEGITIAKAIKIATIRYSGLIFVLVLIKLSIDFHLTFFNL